MQAGYLEVGDMKEIFILETGKKTPCQQHNGRRCHSCIKGTAQSVSFLAAVTVTMIAKALKLLFSVFTRKTPCLK